MVAPNKSRRLVCAIVRVADNPQPGGVSFVRKPSALVPWADPYIAGLVRRLQSEVRLERAAQGDRADECDLSMFDNRGAALWLNQTLVADLEPPSPADGEWEWKEQPRWTVEEDLHE